MEETREPAGCRCGEVLRGVAAPTDCPLFGETCVPEATGGVMHGVGGGHLRGLVQVRRREVAGMKDERVQLAHGSGGKLSHDLVTKVMLPAFANEVLAELHDGARINIQGTRLAFTTDSYVVKPLFFAGGDIGKLAVCGTVNDLAMTGAVPLYLSAGFILEEGFPLADLSRIVASMKAAAAEAGVLVVTGDTKVVEKGAADGIYINTAGIGAVIEGTDISPRRVRPGQDIILSGPIGDHAVAVMAGRYDLVLPEAVTSDCAPLAGLVKADTGGGAYCRHAQGSDQRRFGHNPQ